MKHWMVTLRFKQPIDPQMQLLLPAEQAHVRELMQQEVIEAIYIAKDRSQVWLVMKGENSEQLHLTLSSFPLRKYFEPEITEIN